MDCSDHLIDEVHLEIPCADARKISSSLSDQDFVPKQAGRFTAFPSVCLFGQGELLHLELALLNGQEMQVPVHNQYSYEQHRNPVPTLQKLSSPLSHLQARHFEHKVEQGDYEVENEEANA